MQCTSCLPMTTTIAISPIRLDFNNKMIRLDRKWPRALNGWQKYEEEEEEVKYAKNVSHEEEKSMRIVEAYSTSRSKASTIISLFKFNNLHKDNYLPFRGKIHSSSFIFFYI